MRDPLTIRRGDPFKDSGVRSSGSVPLTPCLIVVSGALPGALIRLEPGVSRIGRSLGNEMRFAEESISRNHAFLRVDAADQAWLSDLCSTNGTYHNGRPLSPEESIHLLPGDLIRLGLVTTLKFVALDAEEEGFHRALYDRSVRDPLTGLHNRAYLFEQLKPLADQGVATGLGMAVLMLDIDHFKQVNDTYGHDAGDAVLKEVAVVLREATRGADLIARYGGEEFVVAILVPAPELAVLVAERIRRGLAERSVEAGGHQVRVTASLGIAYVPAATPWSATELFALADQRLYRAKAEGRDRVVSDLDEQTTKSVTVVRSKGK